MTVYIHPLITYPRDYNGFTGRRKGDTHAAHMATDGDVVELVAFAARIGLRPAWLQGVSPRNYHFDVIGQAKYREALEAGAVEVSTTTLAHLCWLKHSRKAAEL